MKILVTGATGFLGGFLLESLLKKRYDIRILARKTSSLKYLDERKVEIVYGDVNNMFSLLEACKDVDIIIHMASLIHPVNVPDSLYYKINVKGTENVIKAAHKNGGVKQFINVSSVTVYGDVEDEDTPIKEDIPLLGQSTIYGVTKYKGELAAQKLAKRCKIPLTTLRPARIYGERDKSFLQLCKMLKKSLFFNIGPGNTFMQPVYVSDCVDAILASIDNKQAYGGIYNIAGPRAINKKQFLQIVAKNLGTRLSRFNIPVFIVYIAAVLNEAIFKPFGKDPFISRKKLVFFLRSNKYDISAAKRDLAYRPKIDIDEGVKRMVRWFKKEKLI